MLFGRAGLLPPLIQAATVVDVATDVFQQHRRSFLLIVKTAQTSAEAMARLQVKREVKGRRGHMAKPAQLFLRVGLDTSILVTLNFIGTNDMHIITV